MSLTDVTIRAKSTCSNPSKAKIACVNYILFIKLRLWHRQALFIIDIYIISLYMRQKPLLGWKYCKFVIYIRTIIQHKYFVYYSIRSKLMASKYEYILACLL